MPPQDTPLGGGIGIHGWNGEWDESDRYLTFGCISLHQKDLEELYDLVDTGTRIRIVK
ncbi:MAG: L,D-transpeptidase [Bacteroidetes bacterium]|nr:L,D-transpeptidase [Bacteroidota bacterium]